MAVATNAVDAKPRWLSGEELARMEPMRREHLIQDLLPAAGVALIVADAKAGKSTLALELCRAVCNGTRALEHFQAKKGAALYWMADDQARDRFARNYQEVFDGQGLPNFHAGLFRLPLLEGGEDELVSAISRNQARFVVVDALTSIRGAREKDFVKQEYDELRILSDIGNSYQCLIAVLHHQATGKRGSAENPFRQTAGSFAVNAAVDAILTIGFPAIVRTERIVTLAGRDLDATTFLYARDPQRRLFYIGGNGWAEGWDDALKTYREIQTGTFDSSAVGEALGVTDRSGRAKLAIWREAGIVEDLGGRRYAWSHAFMAAVERLRNGSGGGR